MGGLARRAGDGVGQVRGTCGTLPGGKGLGGARGDRGAAATVSATGRTGAAACPGVEATASTTGRTGAGAWPAVEVTVSVTCVTVEPPPPVAAPTLEATGSWPA